MRHRGSDMREHGLERLHAMEVFLKIAAYRATHRGRNPPPNSLLWMEHRRLWKASHRSPLWARIFRPHAAEPDWAAAGPLDRYPMEISFLGEDFSLDDVQARLQAWPMIEGFHLVDSDLAGEWFTCRIDVTAESRYHSRRIVEYIFLLRPQRDLPEMESF